MKRTHGQGSDHSWKRRRTGRDEQGDSGVANQTATLGSSAAFSTDIHGPDDIGRLEALLAACTAAPDKVQSAVGPEAFAQMKSLLALLRGRPEPAKVAPLFPYTIPEMGLHGYPHGPLMPFTPNDVASGLFKLPDLPPIPPGPYTEAPFIHKSVVGTDKVSGRLLPKGKQPARDANGEPYTIRSNYTSPDLPSAIVPVVEHNYERLEFLGDAYLGQIAATLIFTRFPELADGKSSNLKSVLISNETLCHFSLMYKFDQRVAISGVYRSAGPGAQPAPEIAAKAQKGYNKILADVFEAYLAAIILSDRAHGMATVERWLHHLWSPILVRAAASPHTVGPRLSSCLADAFEAYDAPPLRPPDVDGEPATLAVLPPANPTQPPAADALRPYNPDAKGELQQRICPTQHRLAYREVPPKPAHGGFRVDVAFTGWGLKSEVLGHGEGASKTEAGNRAAMDAMFGAKRHVVDECARRFEADKAERKAVREAERDAAREARKEASAN